MAFSDEIQEIVGVRPGGIYLFRCKYPFRSREDVAIAEECLDRAAAKAGCKFVLLGEEFELVRPMGDLNIPGRGSRKDAIAISYDAQRDWLVIDGVNVSPELIVDMITNPDPGRLVSCERKGDVVTVRREGRAGR